MQILFESIIDFVMKLFSGWNEKGYHNPKENFRQPVPGWYEKGYHNPKENFRQPVPYYLCKLSTQTTYRHHELQEH